MLEVFGIQGYEAAMKLSPRMLIRALDVERKRRARARLEYLDDTSFAAGMKFGQEYVDPKNPNGDRKSDDPYYSLKRFQDYRDRLEDVTLTEHDRLARRIARREEEEERDFAKLEAAMGAR